MIYNKVIFDDMEYIEKNINLCSIKNKTILVTGITGMIASYLIMFFNYLNEKNDFNIKIIGLGRNMEKINHKFKNINMEIINQDICKKLHYDNHIDYIFHFASSANPYTIINDPLSIIKANTIGTLNVFELAKEKGAKVIFSSTREVYGKIDNKEKISEEDMGVVECFDSRACYPESKRISETICKSYNVQHNVSFNILRIAHVYGPGMNIENDGRIMSDIIGDVVNSRNIILNSDGKAKRAFCYISDAILGILFVVVKGNNNSIYNLYNENEEVEIKNLCDIVINESGKKLKIEYKITDGKGYTKYSRVGLDNGKLCKLGWNPKISLLEGINKTLTFFNE